MPTQETEDVTCADDADLRMQIDICRFQMNHIVP